MRQDSRETARFRSRIPVRISVRSRIYDGYVIDVSEGGMRISTEQVAELWTGDTISVECAYLGKVSGIVRWRSPGRFGMRFDNATTAKAKANYLERFLVPGG